MTRIKTTVVGARWLHPWHLFAIPAQGLFLRARPQPTPEIQTCLSALLNANGNVIGVVVSQLGLKAVKTSGDIPQNVSYAVKSTYALALLEPYLDSSAPEPNPSAAKPRFEDMVAKAQQSVVLILIYSVEFAAWRPNSMRLTPV